MLVPRATALAAAAVAGAVALSTQVSADGAQSADGVRSSNSATAQVVTTQPQSGLDVIGLTDKGRLVSFSSVAPRQTRRLGKVGGLDGDQSLVGIDYRVQDGKLYGVGNSGGVYTIRPRRGNVWATKVSQLSVPLVGASFGVDFNPAANRLRVISDTGQNLRHNIDDPLGTPAIGMTTTDGSLAFPGVPPAPATPAFGVTAAAYTNNDLDANTSTTLFDIDTSALAQVEVQSPANAGLLAPAGKLTVTPTMWAGFDIYSNISSGSTMTNHAFAVLGVGGKTGLYQVRLLTGKAILVDTFRSNATVVDLAIPLAQS